MDLVSGIEGRGSFWYVVASETEANLRIDAVGGTLVWTWGAFVYDSCLWADGKEGLEFFENGCGAVALDIVGVGRICWGGGFRPTQY